MSLFSRSSKYTIQKASVYLLTATSGVGMLGASQYKAVKSLFDVNTTLTSPTSPLEHSSYPSFPKVHHHHQQAKPIKVIASTEHGFDGHRHPRMRPGMFEMDSTSSYISFDINTSLSQLGPTTINVAQASSILELTISMPDVGNPLVKAARSSHELV